jgi:hypothetical protein
MGEMEIKFRTLLTNALGSFSLRSVRRLDSCGYMGLPASKLSCMFQRMKYIFACYDPEAVMYVSVSEDLFYRQSYTKSVYHDQCDRF